jgi:hypothetical protein
MSFYTETIVGCPEFDTTSRIETPFLLEPETALRVARVMYYAKVMGHELMVFETFRSQERQQLLFDKGASHLKQVGVHHFGLACDLVKSIDGEPSWKGDFGFLGMLARKHGLVWGGDWGSPGGTHPFVDSVHVQRCTVARQQALFASTWYPDVNYDPYKDGAR